jgi:hypothetical protein
MRRLNQGPVPIKDYIDHEVANWSTYLIPYQQYDC